MRRVHPESKKWLAIVVVLSLMILLATEAAFVAARDLNPIVPTRTYNFYYDLNHIQTQIVRDGDNLVAPATPGQTPGWIFRGWVERTTGNPIVFGPQTVTTTEVIEAIAKIDPGWTVKFIYDGKVIKTKTVPTDQTDPANAMNDSDVFFTIQDGTQVFSHWSETPGGPAFPVGTPITKDTTLYVVTKAGSVVQFNSHGGSYVPSAYPDAGSPVTQPPNPTRQGYTFRHWSTSENGPAYNFGLPVNASMTLHAVWTPGTAYYKVLYYLENAEDDLFSFVESRSKSGPTEGTPTYTDATDFINADPQFDETNERLRYYFDHADPVQIAGDGSTVYRLYFKRKIYSFTMYAVGATGGPAPYGQTGYGLYNRANYKYGQSTAPTFDQGLNHPTFANYSWRLKHNGSNMYSEAPTQKSEDMEAWGSPSQGVIYTTHYREAAPGQAGWPTGQPPADKIYGPIKDDFRFSHSGQVWYTFIDGNVPTPGFTLYHLPSEAAKLQQLYNGQLGDPGCNSGDGSIVCHWEPLHSGYNSPSSNPNDTVNCRRIGGTLYCDGTIYYQRLSYKITFHRNITDGFPPVFDVTNIKYQQDISNVIADNAAALDLSTKVESGKTYIFEGWYDNPGFDGNPYSFSGQTMPHSDLILYAKWVLTPVRVNYCRSAGSTECSYLTVPENTQLNGPQQSQIDSYKIPPAGATAADFDGWYFRSDNGSYIKFDLANDFVGENTITLYPIYRLKNYNVGYRLNGGGGTAPDDPNTYTAGSGAIVLGKGAMTAPTGQDFCGWKVEGDASGRIYQPGETLIVNNNKILHAQWCPGIPTTTVTYRPGANGLGTEFTVPDQLLNVAHIVYPLGSGPDQANFTAKPGYVFDGWEGSDGQTYKPVPLVPAPGDAVLLTLEGPGANQKNILTAKWKRALTTVTATKTWIGGQLADHVLVTMNLTRTAGGAADPTFTAPAPTIVPAAGPATNRTYTWANLETHSPNGVQYVYVVSEVVPPTAENNAEYPKIENPDPLKPYEFKVTNKFKSPPTEKEVTKIWKGGFYLDKPEFTLKIVGTCAGCTAVTRTARVTETTAIDQLAPADPAYQYPVAETSNQGAHEVVWKFTWKNLPKNDVVTGLEYVWNLLEDGHIADINEPAGEAQGVWESGCLAGVNPGLSCTNSYKPPLVPPTNPPENPGDPNPDPADQPGEVAGRKIWLGGKATGYADVEIQLHRQWSIADDPQADCEAAPSECKTETVTTDIDGAPVASNFTLLKANANAHKWMHTWTNLPKRDRATGHPIKYWIKELSVGALDPGMGKFIEVEDENGDGEVNADDADLKVTNKYVPPLVPDDPGDPGDNPNPEPEPGKDGNVTGRKIWNGGAPSDHVDIKLLLKRQWKKTPATNCTASPADCGALEDVTVALDGSPVEPRVTLLKAVEDAKPAAEAWRYKWTGLADRDFEHGYKYYYSVVEENTAAELGAYEKETADTDGNPVTVQNNFRTPQTTKTGVKVWTGGALLDKRPSVTLRLCRTLSSAPNYNACDAVGGNQTIPEANNGTPGFNSASVDWTNVDLKDGNGIPYNFWVEEVAAPAGYELVVRNLATITEAARLTVTNNFVSQGLVTDPITGKVIWHGGNTLPDLNLKKAYLRLYRGLKPAGPDGKPADPIEPVGPGVEVTRGADNTASHLFGVQPKYNGGGAEYVYFVDVVTGTQANAPITQIYGDPEQDHFEKLVPPGLSDNQDFNYDFEVDLGHRAAATTFRAVKKWVGGENYNGGVRPDVWFRIQRKPSVGAGAWENVPDLPGPDGNNPANKRIKKVNGSTPVIFYRLEKTTSEAAPRDYVFRVVEVNEDGSPWNHENYGAGATSLESPGNNAANPVEVTNTYRSKKIAVTGTIKWFDGNADEHNYPVDVKLCRTSRDEPAEACLPAVGNIPHSATDSVQTFAWDDGVGVGHGPMVEETDAKGNPYEYYLKHNGPIPMDNYRVEREGPHANPAIALEVHYRYVPPLREIRVVKTWHDGQLQRKAVKFTLYQTPPGGDEIKVPAAGLAGAMTGVAACERTNPVTFTPTLLAVGDGDDTVTHSWCVPDKDKDANPYRYRVEESALDLRMWVQDPKPPVGASDPANPQATIFAVTNRFVPPLINWDDNDPDKDPDPNNPAVDPNQDDGKMQIIKIWRNGKNQRPASLTVNIFREVQGDPSTKVPYAPPSIMIPKPAGNPDIWTYILPGVLDMTPSGQKYLYTVEEVVPAPFEHVSTDNAPDDKKTITNRFPIQRVPVEVSVIWVGGPPAKPTTRILLTCSANGTTVHTQTITYNHPTTVTTVNVPLTDDNGNPVKCKIEQPGGAPSPYVEQPTPGTTEKPLTPPGPVELSITNKYESPNRTITATKTWIDGEKANGGTRPTIWLRLYRKVEGGAAEAVPGAPVMPVPDGKTVVKWVDIDDTDGDGKPYTFHVVETDAGGTDWTPPNYVKEENGLTVTNRYVPPTGEVTGRKIWGRGPSPRPTIWMKLYRQLSSGTIEEVPLSEAPIKELPSGTTQVTWTNVTLTTISGEEYKFVVKEVSQHGGDWTVPGYFKVEKDNTVTNYRLSRIHVGVTTTPLSPNVFNIVAMSGSGMHASQEVDSLDADLKYPSYLIKDGLQPELHAVWIDKLNLEDWRVEGISCVMRPIDSSDPNEDVPLTIVEKRTVSGHLTSEFKIEKMPLEKDVRCMINLRNLRSAKIIVKNTTYAPVLPMVYNYDVEGLAYLPFTLSANAAPNEQEVVNGEFSVKQSHIAGWKVADVIVTSSIGGRYPILGLSGVGTDGETKVKFNVINDEVITVNFINVPPNTIMLKKETLPSGFNDKFRFEGVLAGEIGHGEYLIRTDLRPDGKQHQAIEILDGPDWIKHSVKCVEYGTIGNTETRAEFYTMSAYYGLDEGETIICTFVNRRAGYDDYPDIYDPDLPGQGGDGIPKTGFTPGKVTRLPEQPAAKLYNSSNLTLTIPKLNQTMEIVGIPVVDGEWDVSWLDQHKAGYLEGSSYPTWNGNSVITAHVWDAYNNPGPFAGLKDLKYGDRFTIEAYGKTYTYEIRESERIAATAVNKMMTPKDDSWVTLVTCEAYDQDADKYAFRRIVRAVLIETK